MKNTLALSAPNSDEIFWLQWKQFSSPMSRCKWLHVIQVSGEKGLSLFFSSSLISDVLESLICTDNRAIQRGTLVKNLSNSSLKIAGCHSKGVRSSRLNALIKQYIPKWVICNDTASSVKWIHQKSYTLHWTISNLISLQRSKWNEAE